MKQNSVTIRVSLDNHKKLSYIRIRCQAKNFNEVMNMLIRNYKEVTKQ